ncbi:helicase-associated domain-containing protein [Deinococcus sp. KNUC1210]|uniref:helicase-associated domain-containing protein n=1 Tax=Deinococcus sp. KNUC1210 TaxID=2917691 RepID=UPI001EEFCBEE|nr:helicase-associated domain-containing protein [Deinococcus sp. KNUC1210]ULH14593.1 helicase-associated domain-containing protein [Deinococcus sp. KNUC1210]
MSTPNMPGRVQTGLRLDELLEKMAAPQLIRIAGRYAPGEDVRQIQKARDAVTRALNRPRALKALIETLTPLERFVLDEVRRSPQGVNGWALLLGARLHGLKPGRKPAAVELYRHYRPAGFDGAELIWPLLADGLLMPMTLPNPFVASYGYGLDSGSPLLTADERLLSALPPAPVHPPQLSVGTAQATPPQLVKLHLLELLRGVQEAGGLSLTKQGDVNRSAYKRLQKALPALEASDTLDLWLQVARLDGLLVPDGTALRPAPGAERFSEQDPDLWIQRLAVLYPQLMEASEGESANLAHPGALRAALIGLLSQLQQPTTLKDLEELLQTLTPDELRQPSWRGKPMAWRGWLQGTLNGTLRQLGLVALSADGQTVAPAPALLHQRSSAPSGPAWVVQPNFELVVYPSQLTATHLEVLRAAQAIRFDQHSASYRLTRESVYTALEGGLPLEALLSGLEAASAAPLPAGVRSTLTGWAARRERLVLHQNVTLLEFPTPQERDAHRASFGGMPIGAALLLPAQERKVGKTVPTLRYDAPPAQVLSATAGGLLKVNGELDFLGRALLSQFTQPQRGGYALRPPAPGTVLPSTLLRDLEARTKGHLPALLRLQLDTWSGLQPPPALGTVTLLQHPQAAALLQHPALKPLLEGALGTTLLLVKTGQQQALTLALQELGLTPADGLQTESGGPEQRTPAAAPPITNFRKIPGGNAPCWNRPFWKAAACG